MLEKVFMVDIWILVEENQITAKKAVQINNVFLKEIEIVLIYEILVLDGIYKKHWIVFFIRNTRAYIKILVVYSILNKSSNIFRKNTFITIPSRSLNI